LLHSGGELCVVRIGKQGFLLHFESQTRSHQNVEAITTMAVNELNFIIRFSNTSQITYKPINLILK
jgi:hypothetical protein